MDKRSKVASGLIAAITLGVVSLWGGEALAAALCFNSSSKQWVLRPKKCKASEVTADPRGSAGPAGPQGSPGPAGMAGTTGPAGAVGPHGPTGPTGTPGPTGAQGLAGATGGAGPAGATGSAGPTGATGATGVMGPSGVSFGFSAASAGPTTLVVDMAGTSTTDVVTLALGSGKYQVAAKASLDSSFASSQAVTCTLKAGSTELDAAVLNPLVSSGSGEVSLLGFRDASMSMAVTFALKCSAAAGTCDPSCTNHGAACTSDGECHSCAPTHPCLSQTTATKGKINAVQLSCIGPPCP